MKCPHCGKMIEKEKENWSKILGKSLNKYVAGCKAKFMNRHSILMHIAGQHDLTPEQYRRLEIGINARYGEICSEMSEYIKVKNEAKQ